MAFRKSSVSSSRSETARSLDRGVAVSLLALALSACGGGSGSDGAAPVETPRAGIGDPDPTDPAHMDQQTPTPAKGSFFLANTVSQRVGLPLPSQNQRLDAATLAQQLAGYDPGSLLRCELGGQDAYAAVIDTLGGVRWGYSVSVLEDLSKPQFQSGFPRPLPTSAPATAGNGSAAPPVEIVLPDIVAVTDSAALFNSAAHGLMLVDLTSGQPQFKCATQLPGNVGQFFYRDGHLVAMTQAPGTGHSALLHFRVDGAALRFVEAVDLGLVNILDSRRFNDDLVFYTDLRFASASPVPPTPTGPAPINLGATAPTIAAAPPLQHRALRVFHLGDTLVEKMHDTLIDTTPPLEQLTTQVTRDTPVDTQVSEAHRFGQGMWASDHYFVVTEELSKTFVSGWRSYTYPVCTASHTVETPYTDCQTQYETRPNPDYTPPDNSGGDRGCQGTTLSDCLHEVARVSNPTIQVPVGTHCEEQKRIDWICDAHEQVTAEYPEFRNEQSTRLYIYEYGDAGFVRVDSSVREITNQGLEATSPDAQIPTLTTSTDAFDLAVPGSVQTLYFQNGFLYVISQGVLQVYALGGNSIVRTSTLSVLNQSLQASLFSGDRLYLSDFGWISGSGDHSTLRVVNLANPAFPSVEGASYSLPGGHRSILASDYGIFTIGSVAQFEGKSVNAIKLGLFSDPFVDERAYLILATDLSGDWLGDEKSQFFNAQQQRTLLPYSGNDDQQHNTTRIGISHLEPDQIVSEGAVVVPEAAQRVRPLPGPAESYLSFATSSIEWLTPKEQEWQSAPVLEYFLPNAVYRLDEHDDYVEVQRLGNRCKLYFANASNINQRGDGAYSEQFACFGWLPQAYEHQLLFADTGIEFDPDTHSLRSLSADEVAATRARIAERPTCMLSLDLTSDPSVNYDTLPNAKSVLCLSPTEYQVRYAEKLNPKPTP